MLRDICPTGVDCPDRIRNLAPDQNSVVRISGSQGYVRLALGQIDIAVAKDEFDFQIGMADVEALEQAGLGNTNSNRLRTGQPHRSDLGPYRILEVLLECMRGGGDALGVRQHHVTEIRQSIAALLTLD